MNRRLGRAGAPAAHERAADRRACLRVLQDKESAQVSQLRKLFRKFDLDNSGLITVRAQHARLPCCTTAGTAQRSMHLARPTCGPAATSAPPGRVRAATRPPCGRPVRTDARFPPVWLTQPEELRQAMKKFMQREVSMEKVHPLPPRIASWGRALGTRARARAHSWQQTRVCPLPARR